MLDPSLMRSQPELLTEKQTIGSVGSKVGVGVWRWRRSSPHGRDAIRPSRDGGGG